MSLSTNRPNFIVKGSYHFLVVHLLVYYTKTISQFRLLQIKKKIASSGLLPIIELKYEKRCMEALAFRLPPS